MCLSEIGNNSNNVSYDFLVFKAVGNFFSDKSIYVIEQKHSKVLINVLPRGAPAVQQDFRGIEG